MTIDSSTISISVTPSAASAKEGKSKALDSDADAFSISLEVAQDKADGEKATTSITIQGVATESAEAATGEPDGEVTIEIETVVFSGDELSDNLSASTVLGGGSVAVTEDGSFGVSGSISGDAEVRLEVGETLTFELPPVEGEVVGGQVTITNLFSNGEEQEAALVFAYDADDRQLASYFVVGNETGSVTVDIDVAFARLDFKAVDNHTFLFEDNANFGVRDISATLASVIDELPEGASQRIDDIIEAVTSNLPKIIDLGHFGTVNFEITRVSADALSNINGISRVGLDQDREAERAEQADLERKAVEPEERSGGWVI